MKDTSIKKVLVIGSGPIVIGQAAEFDYAGTQACRALREEGVETVLLNSNPATIMTDKDIAVPAFRNLNDGTNEGFLYKGRNILTVQFHPEASPGPCDSGFLFDEFAEMMSRRLQNSIFGGGEK